MTIYGPKRDSTDIKMEYRARMIKNLNLSWGAEPWQVEFDRRFGEHFVPLSDADRPFVVRWPADMG